MSGWHTRPNAPAPGTPLCAAGEVPLDNGREFVFGAGSQAFRLVLFRSERGVRAYVNECPHFHVPYNFDKDVFCVYDIDGRRDLMCAHHTAMFHLDDGHCYEGPCAGATLAAVPLAERHDGTLVIERPDRSSVADQVADASVAMDAVRPTAMGS